VAGEKVPNQERDHKMSSVDLLARYFMLCLRSNVPTFSAAT